MLDIPEEVEPYADDYRMSLSVLMAVAGAANAKIDYHAFEKGEGKMCTLFEEIAEEGRVAGRKEGRAAEIIETGIEFELQDSDIIERLQRKLEISLQKAEEYFRQFSGQRV